MTKYLDVKDGDLLAAEPFMTGGPFKKSVILMCEHSRDEGSLGFIVNRGTQFRLDSLIKDFPDCDFPVFYGGPVATDTIHYIHRVGDLLEDSKLITSGIYWGGDFNKIKYLVQHGLIKSFDIKFFIGYSGWSPGQIYDELKDGTWIVTDTDVNYVFNTKPTTWTDVVESQGYTYKVIADMSDKLNFN
jgi:putative transcriptional regulator